MEWFGLMGFGILMCYYAYPKKVDILERKVSKLEKTNRGGNQMSKIIAELKGKECKILVKSVNIKCEILEVDEEWVRYIEVDKKDPKIKIVRIDDIDCIEL